MLNEKFKCRDDVLQSRQLCNTLNMRVLIALSVISLINNFTDALMERDQVLDVLRSHHKKPRFDPFPESKTSQKANLSSTSFVSSFSDSSQISSPSSEYLTSTKSSESSFASLSSQDEVFESIDEAELEDDSEEDGSLSHAFVVSIQFINPAFFSVSVMEEDESSMLNDGMSSL